MAKHSFAGVVKIAQRTVVKHAPEILTGIGIAGMITSTVLAVKATPRALTLLEEVKRSKEEPELKPTEVVKATWKCYIPAAVTAVASTACLIGASSVHLRRTAALATAYELSKTALAEYSDKVVEVVGEETEQRIREQIDKDRVEKNPPPEAMITSGADTLCYDALSGRYFFSNVNEIDRAINMVNRNLLSDLYVSLNEFYDELGQDHTALGDTLGWNLDDGRIDISYRTITEDNRDVTIISYSVAPKYNYYKLT